MDIVTKRIYDQPDAGDGLRVLIDRLWPRGVKRDLAQVDLWLKAVTPSPDLRKWWNHDPQRLTEFAERYRQELEQSPAREALDELAGLAREQAAAGDRLTLLYGAKDPKVNHAVILHQVLLEALG